jgi:hypothetical protein
MKKLISRFKNPSEFWALAVGFVTALAFFIGSFKFTGMSAVFPRFISLLGMIFVAMYAAIRILNKKIEDPKITESKEEPPVDKQGTKRMLLTFGCFVGCLIIVWLFGFLIAVMVFSVSYPLLMGYRSPIGVIICLILNTGLVLGFQKMLSLSLCRGLFVDLSPLFF